WRALEVFRVVHGEKHPRVAVALHNLAAVCQAQGDLAQARAHYQQALDLHKALHGAKHPDVAFALNNLAVVFGAQGDLAPARRHAQQALDLYRALHGERHPHLALALRNLASVGLAEGAPPRGARSLIQAVLACRLPRVNHQQLADLRADDLTCAADTVGWLQELGWVLQSSGQGSKTARQAAQAFDLA